MSMLDTHLPRKCRPAHAVLVGSALFLVIATVVSVLSVKATNEYGGGIRFLGRKSRAGVYQKGAVISDYEPCSKIGSDIMRLHNGSAVDAAVATSLCTGVTDIQACGIGGGLFMTIYDTPTNELRKVSMTINGREMAPLSAHRDMFKGAQSSMRGAQSIAVPGELKALHEAWRRFGRLTWRQVVQPAIDVARSGFIISSQQSERIEGVVNLLRQFSGLRNILIKPNGRPYGTGDVMKRPILAETLERIRDEGADTFYTGSLAEDIIADIQDTRGNITLKDLKLYTAKVESALKIPLANGKVDLLVPGLPSGGPIMQFMLRVMDGFDFSDRPKYGLKLNLDLHQAFIETFKFAYAMRSYLGDADFVNVTESMRNLTSDEFIRDIHSRIDLDHTHRLQYYHGVYAPARDHGTAHLSVASPDGGAVSVTSSINFYFGSLIVGRRTGIIFNNEMDDFSTPDTNNEWGLRPSEANYIEARKQPLSSMSPAILLDRVTQQPCLVIGGAGGSKITSILSFVTYLSQYLDLDLLKAVDFPRVHHQLLPNVVKYESDVAQYVIKGLRQKGHILEPESTIAVINGIHRRCDVTNVCLSTAVGDWRRGGKSWGWN